MTATNSTISSSLKYLRRSSKWLLVTAFGTTEASRASLRAALSVSSKRLSLSKFHAASSFAGATLASHTYAGIEQETAGTQADGEILTPMPMVQRLPQGAEKTMIKVENPAQESALCVKKGFQIVEAMEDNMPTYVLLSTLTPEGRQTLHRNPDRLEQVNREIADFGCQVVAQYAVLGAYDFVSIVEAPDNETAAHLSVDLGSRGAVEIITMPAIDTSDLLRKLKENKQLSSVL